MASQLGRLEALSIPLREGLERLLDRRRFVHVFAGLSPEREAGFRQAVESYPVDEIARYFFRFRSYVVVVAIADIDGRAEPVGVEVKAQMAGVQPRLKPFKAGSLRPPWAKIIAEALRWHAETLEALATADPGVPDNAIIAAARKSARRRSLAAQASSQLRPSSEEVGRVYREAVARHDPPRLAVALHFDVTPSKAGHLVERARDDDELPDAPGPGRAGLSGHTKKRRKDR